MKMFVNGVYKMRGGGTVLITGAAKVSDRIWYWRGTTQDGKIISYDDDGKSQFIGSSKPQYDLVDRELGVDEENFKVFEIGALFVTPGDRVWEVVAFSRCEKYPIIAKKLLPDGSFHGDIGEFNWEGKCLAGPHYLWKRVGP